ncbi:UNKNOWN [Stylonychia lemnae]|uniref:Serine/threonine protein phosphatase 2A regulatory subunit n=1 Tax=Stylonychia lemnae TaxID=5949 RepID=A0A077ZY45_STYLE|nr:UNKNOWN [Stylonychia lemnae]|eukprot:CDW73456.1 UNKNOWN [Stylonychia lemnae]
MRAFLKQLEDGLKVMKELKNLPWLKDILANSTPEQIEEVFIVKIRSCCVLFDFSNDNNKHMEEKDIKRKILLELIAFLEQPLQQKQSVLTERVTFNGKIGEESIENKIISGDPDEEQIFLEESWPHIQIVYELLLRIIIQPSIDVRILKNHITQDFVLKLIALFKSPDPRERDYLKTIIHRIYGKFMVYRSFIRKVVSSYLLKVVVDDYEDQFGHSEYLEILGSIITGFAVPLKGEHRQLYEQCLIPLHKSNHVQSYHQQLVQCVLSYLEKDPSVADQCIKFMFRYWPVTNPNKEVLFLNELEEILEVTTNDVVERVGIHIIKRLNKCIISDHFQVAERSLFMFNNDKLNWLVKTHKETVMPIIIEGLMKNANSHWNATVQGLTFYVLKILVEIDSQLFDQVSEDYYNRSQNEILKRARLDQKWRRLDQKIQYRISHK